MIFVVAYKMNNLNTNYTFFFYKYNFQNSGGARRMF